MKRTGLILAVILGILALAVWYLVRGTAAARPDVIYRTGKVERGTVTMSFIATGILQPLTTVDVKSKAGGEIVRLAVQEGDVVKQGDLIAVIDPRDSRAVYEQSSADLDASLARLDQSRYSLEIERITRRTAVENAEAALATARLRLQTLEARATAQPALTEAAVTQARANHEAAIKSLDTMRSVTAPQTRAQVQGDLSRAKAELEAAEANLKRQEELLALGYVSRAQYEQARTQRESAAAAYKNAEVRASRVEDDLKLQIEAAEARVAQAKATLDQALASRYEIGVSQRDLAEARENVKTAQANLETAKANLKQVDVRQTELRQQQAAIVRTRVARDNAKVNLESTTVVAPRDGVVTTKYVEQGTIIPPGLSTFAQGTSIVQIADVTRMYVEVNVDEADVAKVQPNQEVRVTLESDRRNPLKGHVSRINPAAVTTGGVTQVKVRVEIEPTDKVKLMPGLNASCEFILTEKENVLTVPSQAVIREGGKSYVEVMVAKDKPQRREVKTGVQGNAVVEITEGLNEGEEIVVSKIDMKQIEEQQRRMEDAATQRNPFSGPGTSSPGPRGQGGGMGGGGAGR